jgi:hypothetical protein
MIERSVSIRQLAIVQPVFPSFKYFILTRFFEHSGVRFQHHSNGIDFTLDPAFNGFGLALIFNELRCVIVLEPLNVLLTRDF